MWPGFFKLVHAKTVFMTLHESDTPGYRQVLLDGRSHPTPDEEIREYICNENNKDAAHMVGK
jgi:hypothetical protein